MAALQPTGLEKIKFLEKISFVPEKRGIKRSFILFLRVILVSVHRFLIDDCLTRASAIAYTNIVSLVPVLTVALAFITITSGVDQQQDQFFDSINKFLLKNEIKIDLAPYIETLKEIIGSASQIGAVGFIVLIFSATAILRTFEAAFNQIWRISTPRPFTNKIIFYFFIISIGPLMLATLLSFATKFADAVRSSHLYSVTRSSNNYIWITGENGTIVKIDEKGKRLAKLKDFKIDLENIICIDLEDNQDISCDVPKLNKESFIKIRNRKQQLVTISDKGVLLQSTDLGINWTLINFYNAKILDFTIADEKNLFILLSNGEIINYHEKNKFDKVVLNYPNGEGKVLGTRIRFPDPLHGYLTDANGYFWRTEDGGKTFIPSNVTKGTLNLTDFAVIDEKTYIAVGERGSIYYSNDLAKTWKDISHKKTSYTKIWNMENEGKQELIILNEIGNILYSYDLGEKWNISYSGEFGKLNAMLPINPKFGFAALNPDDDDVQEMDESIKKKFETAGDVLAVGDFGNISIGDFKDNSIKWKKIAGGDNLFSLYSLINTIIPLLAIWLFFLLLYTLIPHTKVPLKAAMIGAAITGVILLLFVYLYGIYIQSFSSSTLVVYRALAAVPLFLLMIYCLSIIILFGAEITATLHYKYRYVISTNPFSEEDNELKFSFYNSIRLMVNVYEFQIKNKNFIPKAELKEKLNLTETEYLYITDQLISEKIITKTEDQTLAPTRNPSELDLYELFSIVVKESYSYPEINEKQKFVIKIDSILKEIDTFTKEHLVKIKFSELLS